MSQPPDNHYQVAILGGGIAGLTLALILERLGITWTLWESHETISPEIGAGIGLLPNGFRILDQLGLLDRIEKLTVPLETWYHVDENGEPIAVSDAQRYYRFAVGYDARFVERSKLLRIIYDGIDDKSLVRTSMELSRIDQGADYFTIAAVGRIRITANVVVGADGARSSIRKYIGQSIGRQIKKEMQAQFTCIFGMSPGMSELERGEAFAVYHKGATVLAFTGKRVIFWFVFEDLGHTFPLSYNPSYDIADIEEVCQAVGHLHLTPTVKFGDIYANRSSVQKTTLEEGLAEHWHANRMVVVGDAAHKMVPHAAMGANQAIESAAALANELQKLGQVNEGWTTATIATALEKYTQARRDRVATVVSKAGAICRAQLCCPGHDQLVKALPKLSFADWMTQSLFSFRGASRIESLPMTERGKYYEERLKSFFDKWDKACGMVEGIEKPQLTDETFWEMFECGEWKG
ncbi:hypothetical protein PHISCL_04063 [Aspergillus sclerotialis]|uniref:FAD-binding domain-containing protein n=1 Tax=Aspergillus sclerotialis TaxID=2070753 RepID=A0A3A2ZQ68_9EURO|nr:hypothetical protein PHISCL_04063 [Aspergillus sclerotialis]